MASQKLTKNRIDVIRQYNPDFIVLQYHKAYVYWWSEYEIDLGAFVTPPTQNLADLLVAGSGSLYQRRYEKGLVLVNPGESAQSYALTGDYYRVTFSGGGYVEENTKPAMTLTHSTSVNGTVSVAPHTALILWKEPSDAVAYVSPNGSCGGKTPCFSHIQDAVDWNRTTFTINIGQGFYNETFTLKQPKNITVQGGWNVSFDSQVPNTTTIKAPSILQGSLTIQELIIVP